MSEKVVKAITIKAADYKENDKIVKLFTTEGIISAQAKGIKKANAKLKFCVQPFCFSEVVLYGNKGFYTITGAEIIDTFFDLTQEYERYAAACAVLESLDAFDAMTANEAMVLILKTFQAFLSGKIKENLLKFFIEALKITGYEYEFACCSECGKKSSNKFWFDLQQGIMCDICKTQQAVPVSQNTQSAMRIICATDLARISTVKLNDSALIEALMLIGVIYRENNNITLNSIKELVNG